MSCIGCGQTAGIKNIRFRSHFLLGILVGTPMATILTATTQDEKSLWFINFNSKKSDGIYGSNQMDLRYDCAAYIATRALK